MVCIRGVGGEAGSWRTRCFYVTDVGQASGWPRAGRRSVVPSHPSRVGGGGRLDGAERMEMHEVEKRQKCE